jgi:putative zinc finger/helix-turn-helix YgiT family protein
MSRDSPGFLNDHTVMISLKGQICPFCQKGKFVQTKIDYKVGLPDDQSFIVPRLAVDRCDQCAEIAIPGPSSRRIEAAIAEHTEQLTPRELKQIREDLALDQTEMSEILGLGSKTYHRWEHGTQYPSRSMGYYLRVLHEFSHAFDWLRMRGWRKQTRNGRIRKGIQRSGKISRQRTRRQSVRST